MRLKRTGLEKPPPPPPPTKGRQLALLLCGVLLAVGLSVPTLALRAQPVHAYANCSAAEGDDQVHEDTNLYRSKRYWVWDSYDPTRPGHWVDTDIKTYHVSHAGSCWRGYYTSAWLEDGTTAYLLPWIRAWVCGQGPYQFNSGTGAATNRYAVSGGSWGPSAWINYNVQMWDGTWQVISFAPYGDVNQGTLCGPQEDQYGSRAWTDTWYNPPAIYSDPSNPYWYVSGW